MKDYSAVRLLVAKIDSKENNIEYYIGGNSGTDRNVFCEG